MLPWLILLFVGLLTTVRGSMPTPDSLPVSDDYLLNTWEVEDGLCSNSILEIAQDADGYVWLATPDGLMRFDGVHFTPFLKADHPGLASNHAEAVFTARNGDLWIGLERGGVARMHGGRFETIVPLLPEGKKAWTRSFAEDADGGVWFAYFPGRAAYRWKDGKLDAFSGEQGIAPGYGTTLHSTSTGTIWFSTDAYGIFDGTRFKPLPLERFPASGDTDQIHMAASRDGGMWVARSGQLLKYGADGSWEKIADLGAVGGSTVVNMMFEDREHALWLATRGAGLVRWSDGRFTRMPTSLNNVATVTEDREGDIWAGTYGGGLNRLRKLCVRLHTPKRAFYNDKVMSVCEDGTGRMWLAPWMDAPVRAIDAANQRFEPQPGWGLGLVHGKVASLCADPDGGIWLGFASGGLMHLQDGVFRWESFKDGITGLFVDRRGNVWAAAESGIICRRQGAAGFAAEDWKILRPRALAEDGGGRLWVGTEDGLVFCREKEAFVSVPLPGFKAGQSIRFILADGKDTVWIGAKDSGLYRERAGKISRMPENAGLPLDDLHSMAIDLEGGFWIGAGRGLLRVARTELEAAMDGDDRLVRVDTFGRDDGLPYLDFSYGFLNAATRTRDGHLWFGTSRGALEISPGKFSSSSFPPRVLVEEVQEGDRVLPSPGREGFVLAPNPGPLTIRYSAPKPDHPEKLRFRYRLAGLNDEWIPAQNQRAALFTRLPPGAYRFEVEVAEINRPWLPATASLAFTVRAAWWETAWFRVAAMAAAAAVFAALGRLIVHRRLRVRMQALEQRHAIEKERARLARDLHDQVGASLTQIALMAKLAATPARLAQLADSARQAVDALDGVVWTANPHNDTLESLLQYLVRFAEDFLKGAGLRYQVDLPSEVPARPLTPDFRHHVLLIAREALNNAVKYAHATEILVKCTLDREALTLSIRDNGRGFDPAGVASGGNGLVNMQARAEELQGRCLVESVPGKGAAVTLIAPWPLTPPLL